MKPLFLAGSLSVVLAVPVCALVTRGDAPAETLGLELPGFTRTLVVVPELPPPAPAPEPEPEPRTVPQEPKLEFALKGMVRIPGGPTVVGADQKEMEKRLLEERNPDNRWVLAGEIGRHVVEVEEFWISPTEVTNELYLEYVRASGARPPSTWAVVPKELKEATILEKQKTDPTFKWDEDFQLKWWSENWTKPDAKWDLPPEKALEPVVSITYEEALGFCEWAGVRLPTEAELIRAGRGDGEQEYPFGAEFKREIVAHNTTLPAQLAFKRLPVAMFSNASQFGVYDLVGNVFEWTSDLYLPFPDFPKSGVKLKIKGEKNPVTVMPNWDASRRVVKGGSFNIDPNFCRLDVRVGFDPTAASPALGFRVAASARPGVDAALIRARHLRSSLLGGKPEQELDGKAALALERRTTPEMEPIAARRGEPQKPFRAPELPTAYHAFGKADVLTVVPRKDPFGDREHPETQTIVKDAQKEWVFPPLGVLVTSYPLREPELPAGTYVLAWMPTFDAKQLHEMGAQLSEKHRPKSAPKKDEPAEGEAAPEAKPDAKQPSVDVSAVLLEPDKEHLLFVDADGKAVGAVALVDDLKHTPKSGASAVLVMNLERDSLDYRMQFPGRTGKVYSVRFRMKGVAEDGNSLARDGWWAGAYDVLKPPPGSRSIGGQPALPK